MMNIKPVSDLRNYNQVLNEVTHDQPVFLTKNGRGKYAVIDIEDYDRLKASLEILEQLKKAETSETVDLSIAKKRFHI